MSGPEMTWFVVMGGIALFVGLITLMDGIGRRQRLRREAQEREARQSAAGSQADVSHASSSSR